MLQKQQTVAEATADITAVVRTFSGNMAKENEQKKAQAEKAYEDRLKEQNDGSYERFMAQDDHSRHLQMLANDSAYAAADIASREWGIGGSNSRLLNAATTLITGTLGGQTDLQVAANTLAPYASAGIGRSVGHGENKNEAAQAVGHFVLGATLAYINGGDPLSGGGAAVAAEATAQYLARQYDDGKTARDPISGEFNPNLLPESVKEEIRATTGAIAAVVGATGDGGAALNAQISGVIGQNAVENNSMNRLDGYTPDERAIRDYAGKIYSGDKQKAAEFVREYEKYQLTAMLKAGKDIAVGTWDTIRHPIDSAVSLYETVTNPKQTYKNIVLSYQEWNTLYNNALITDIPLAARMKAEMNATIGANATTFVVSGGTASLIQKSLQSGRLAQTARVVKNTVKIPDSIPTTSINPNTIRFSQNTVSYSKIDRATGKPFTYDDLVSSMKTKGWQGEPVDIIKMPDNKLTSMDNTRIRAARDAGINVKANVHNFNDPLPKYMIDEGRFREAKTWGEAITQRIQDQRPKSFGNKNPDGSSNAPKITGKPK